MPRLAFRLGFAKLARLKKLFEKLTRSRRYLFAALAGLVLAAAFPKINLAGAAWVAPGLILACAYNCTGGKAWRIGYSAGLAQWLALLSWLLHIPVTGFPILGWIALAAFMAIYPAFWVWLVAGKIGQGSWLRRCFWSLGGAAAWVALEMIRARLLSGFPWNNLGVSQWQMTPLIQIAAVTGVYGVSFLVVWVSLSLYSSVQALLRHPTTRYVWMSEVALPVIALMVVFNLGLARIRNAPPTDSSLRVTFVQPAVPQTMIWDTSENTNRFKQLLAVARTHRRKLHRHHEPRAAASGVDDVQRGRRRRKRQSHARSPLRHFQCGLPVQPGRSMVRCLSQTAVGHLRRIHSAGGCAAVREMVHAHHRRLHLGQTHQSFHL
jgi:apolipoprotein N-acyltransferase